jgi:hypothetical protein
MSNWLVSGLAWLGSVPGRLRQHIGHQFSIETRAESPMDKIAVENINHPGKIEQGKWREIQCHA